MDDEKTYTAREWFDYHEMIHAGQACAGSTFLDFIGRWSDATQYTDPFFLFTEVGSTLVMNSHTEAEWLEMVQAIVQVNMLRNLGGFVVIPVEMSDEDDEPSFADSVKRTIDGLDGER